MEPTSEEQFRKGLLDEYGARDRFGHLEHLHVAWSYLCRDGTPAAAAGSVVDFVKHVAAQHGAPDKANETLTRFWVHAVATSMVATTCEDFDLLVERAPHLTCKNLPYRHWSAERLRSPEAKQHWVEPDLRPLAALPDHPPSPPAQA